MDLTNLKKDTLMTELETIMSKIAKDFDLDYNGLLTYINNSNIKSIYNSKNSTNIICKARKQDGLRCTRRCKDGGDFCGKHINHQKYGCVKEITGDDIELDEITYKENIYYIDVDNIAYSKIIPDNKFKIIGKKMKNGQLHFIDQNNSINKPCGNKSIAIS